MSYTICFCFIIYVLSIFALPTPQDYSITSLPLYNGSFSSIPFKQYSGYIPLDDEDETSLFFWFVESQNNPTKDPVVLWNNGGPGVSSIYYGFFTEHGPFRLEPNATMINSQFYNKYSWNKIANVIYLESPSGVGFSYSLKQSGYNCTDQKTAKLHYLFIDKFRQIFTDFNHLPFYITGESYVGHYGPDTAQYIIQQNKSKEFNIGGLLIGNPRTDEDCFDGPNHFGTFTYLWSHGLMPQIAYVNAVNKCNWNSFLLKTQCNNSSFYQNPNDECMQAIDIGKQYIPNNKQWDIHNIYAPTCHSNGDNMYTKYYINNEEFPFYPCMSEWTAKYVNREDVLIAIHAIDDYNSSIRTWPNHPNGWHYGTQLYDVSSLYAYFMEQEPQWKISIVDGDADPVEPLMAEQKWIECLNRKVVKDWTNWYFQQDVAGSVKTFDGITFQTVKHCGHMISTYCPSKGYQFFFDYIKGTYSE